MTKDKYLTDQDIKLSSVGVIAAEDVRPSAPLIEPHFVTDAIPVTVQAASVIVGGSGHVPCHPDVPANNLMPISEEWANSSARNYSEQVNRDASNSSAVGYKLSKEEEDATRKANRSGAADSRRVNQGIAQSRNTDHLSDFYIYSANRTGDSNVVVAQPLEDGAGCGEQLKGQQTEPPKSKGYQFTEYKSMYDDGYGGSTYQPQEYKSIYD